MEIIGRQLTTCQVDATGTSFRMGFEAEDGRPAAVILPVDCLRSLLMTLPGVIERALRARYKDDTVKLIYPTGGWSLHTAVRSNNTILTMKTVDGFEVAFALAPEDVDGLVTSLVESERLVPVTPAVN